MPVRLWHCKRNWLLTVWSALFSGSLKPSSSAACIWGQWRSLCVITRGKYRNQYAHESLLVQAAHLSVWPRFEPKIFSERMFMLQCTQCITSVLSFSWLCISHCYPVLAKISLIFQHLYSNKLNAFYGIAAENGVLNGIETSTVQAMLYLFHRGKLENSRTVSDVVGRRQYNWISGSVIWRILAASLWLFKMRLTHFILFPSNMMLNLAHRNVWT